MAKLLLIAAVWLALAGAALVNQYALLDYCTRDICAALSVILWVVQALAAAAIIYLIIPPDGSEDRLATTVRFCYPLVAPLWLLVVSVFYLKLISDVCFVPIIVLSTVPLVLWRGNSSRVAWPIAIATTVLAFVALFVPFGGIWVLIGVCGSFVLFAKLCSAA
jgi:hypothetical protein